MTKADPDYHFKAVTAALKLAKEKLPKVEAIGGSATGTVGANNEATWCDIFPNVPPPIYKQKVVDIFQRIAKDVAGSVPLKVINDGEVTALAAVQKLDGKGNIMGISMGSSEGAGYANADGHLPILSVGRTMTWSHCHMMLPSCPALQHGSQGNLMGWINELCYVKLDMNPEAGCVHITATVVCQLPLLKYRMLHISIQHALVLSRPRQIPGQKAPTQASLTCTWDNVGRFLYEFASFCGCEENN